MTIVQTDTGLSTHCLTHKYYELTDHLGNVRSVVGDTKWNEGNGIFRPNIISYPIIIPLVWRKRAEIGAVGNEILKIFVKFERRTMKRKKTYQIMGVFIPTVMLFLCLTSFTLYYHSSPKVVYCPYKFF